MIILKVKIVTRATVISQAAAIILRNKMMKEVKEERSYLQSISTLASNKK